MYLFFFNLEGKLFTGMMYIIMYFILFLKNRMYMYVVWNIVVGNIK